MGKKLQQLTLVVELLLYIFDLGSDIYVAIKHWENNDVWWFGMTTGFILVPSIIVNITAFVQVFNFWRTIMAVLQLSFVVRYIETVISPYGPVTRRTEDLSLDRPVSGWGGTTSADPPVTIWSETTSRDPSVTGQSETTSPDRRRIFSLSKLRYLQTITESAPQLCLQVYIMLRQWDFPTFTVVSSVLSLLSLAWSSTTLEKERKIEEQEDYKSSAALLFLIWQLFTLTPRLSAIVVFAYVFRYYAIIFLAAHWLLLSVAILIIQRREYYDGDSLFFSCLAAYPSLFHSSETVFPTASPKVEMIMGYILIMLENIFMVTLSLTIEIACSPHIDILKPVAILCLVGGSVVSILFIVLYYLFVDADDMDSGDVVTFSFLGVVIV